MHRRELVSASAALIVALVLHLTATAVHSENVTTQVKSFKVKGTISGDCFTETSTSVLVEVAIDLPPVVLSAAASLLQMALSSVEVEFAASGTLQIQRHGENGAVFHLEWGASLMQASLALTATNTKEASEEVYAATATAGAFASAGAATSESANSKSLATVHNLGTVDAKNITEARSSIVFGSRGFASAESNVDISVLAHILTSAASNNFVPGADLNAADVDAAIQAAAQAVAEALARSSVLTAIEGHYKAMRGPDRQTDLLSLGVTSTASVTLQCSNTSTVTVNAMVSIN